MSVDDTSGPIDLPRYEDVNEAGPSIASQDPDPDDEVPVLPPDAYPTTDDVPRDGYTNPGIYPRDEHEEGGW